MRVRMIDKRSPHYKQKVVVAEVSMGGHAATVVTDEGTTIAGGLHLSYVHHSPLCADVSSAYLETVIPRSSGSQVRLVREGSMASLVEADRRKQTAIVQMHDDEDDKRVVHFDDICECLQ